MEKTTPPKSPSTVAVNRAANVRRAEKNARKRASREAARKSLAAKKRRQAALGAFAAVAVVAVVVVLVVTLGGGKSSKPAAAAGTASGVPSAPASDASAPPSAAPSTPASAAAFPPLPPGANPALKTKPVVKAGTGKVTKLSVKTLIQGTGAAIKSGDSITVNYVGVTYIDGKEFDSSWKNSQALTTTIGVGGVIPGWDQGLIGVKVGSRVQLDIPTALAYNNQAGAPPGVLRFVVDVLATGPASS